MPLGKAAIFTVGVTKNLTVSVAVVEPLFACATIVWMPVLAIVTLVVAVVVVGVVETIFPLKYILIFDAKLAFALMVTLSPTALTTLSTPKLKTGVLKGLSIRV